MVASVKKPIGGQEVTQLQAAWTLGWSGSHRFLFKLTEGGTLLTQEPLQGALWLAPCPAASSGSEALPWGGEFCCYKLVGVKLKPHACEVLVWASLGGSSSVSGAIAMWRELWSGHLREGDGSRVAEDLPFVLGLMLLGTLLGDTFNFRLGGSLALLTAAFDHIAS